jgi:primary-amine oxidase
MAAIQEAISPQAHAAKHTAAHPLCPLTASEISNTAQLIKRLWPPNVDILFKVITLEEPQKAHFVPYLDAEHAGRALPRIDRKAFVAYYLRNTVRCLSYVQENSGTEPLLQDKFHEAIVNLSAQTVETNVRLGANQHGNSDYPEILMVEKNALEDEGVKAEIAKLQLPEGSVICADPWIYGESYQLPLNPCALTRLLQDPMASTMMNASSKSSYTCATP